MGDGGRLATHWHSCADIADIALTYMLSNTIDVGVTTGHHLNWQCIFVYDEIALPTGGWRKGVPLLQLTPIRQGAPLPQVAVLSNAVICEQGDLFSHTHNGVEVRIGWPHTLTLVPGPCLYSLICWRQEKRLVGAALSISENLRTKGQGPRSSHD